MQVTDAMPQQMKNILQLIADNVFWAFVILMIIMGSVVDSPFINVGLTAR
jgi:TRAP-type C4-dicarboxylate transport system permease small subunit